MSGYIFESKEHGQYSPEGKVSDVVNTEEHNRQLEQTELQAFATKPARWGGYVAELILGHRPAGTLYVGTRIKVSTWLGTVLATGHVTAKYRGNFHDATGRGAMMLRIRVRGTNGVTYVGTLGHDNQFVRLRAVKG